MLLIVCRCSTNVVLCSIVYCVFCLRCFGRAIGVHDQGEPEDE
uniref:Uncharacterized protein n=1 Tax=Lutzomyia longipalpis TaxID=7200 RepID=A0A1B0CLM1_LUTLO